MPRPVSRKQPTLPTTETLWCLLIGVSEYQDQTLSTLPYAIADCQGLADALQNASQKFPNKEFTVHRSSPNLSKIRASLEQIVKAAKPQDTLFFYFSGHGIIHVETQQAVLCLADTQTDNLLGTGLKISSLLQELGNCAALQQIVVLDACHSGGLSLRESPTPQLVEQLQQVAKQKKQTGKNQSFYALLSCDKEQRSWEFPELGHGIFTYYLIKGLQGEAADPQGEIEITLLYKYVYHRTLQYIKKLNQQRSLVNKLKSRQGDTNNLYPEQPQQTPKLIVEAVGEMVLGSKTNAIGNDQPLRKALIVDGLQDGNVTQAISNILGAAGGFDLKYWHSQVRDLPDIRLAIEDCLKYQQSDSESTALLYLRGIVEEAPTGEALLVLDNEIKLSRSWLQQVLRQSRIDQQIIVLDFLGTTSLQEWLDNLRLESESSQCLLVGAGDNIDEFSNILLKTLQNKASSQDGLSVAGWITAIQLELASSTMKRDFWLGGVRGIIEVLPASVEKTSERVDLGICPYMGLRAFSEKDTRYFYGREALTQRMINEINQKSFIALVGASGSGKSSAVQAGLIAQLRLGQQLPGSEEWLIISLRPGSQPIRELGTHSLEALLYLGGEGFVHWLRQRSEPMVVLFVDQFEELFTLAPTSDREAFLNILLEALEYASDQFKLIITLRADFIAPCLEIPQLAQKLQESSILVPPRLTESDYRQAIEKPAEQVQLKVEPGLVELLLQDLQQSVGDLPLLQFVLEQLWEKRDRSEGELTTTAYREQIGGLKGALSRKAQAVYNSLTEKEQTVAQWIFLSLTQLGSGTEDTKRQLSKAELLQGKYPQTLVEQTLQKFIEAKLIVINQDTNISTLGQSRSTDDDIEQELEIMKAEVTVEVAHEILIRHWSTLRWWLDENRDRLYQQQRLEKKAKEWLQKGKPSDYLLQKTQLTEAEIFVKKYQDYLKPLEREYIQASKKARRNSRFRLGGFVGIFLSSVLILGAIAFQQQQQSRIAQLVRYASFRITTPELASEILDILPALLSNAEKNQKAGNIEKALDDYRQIINLTNSLQDKIKSENSNLSQFTKYMPRLQEIKITAEKSLASIISQTQIPQLEAELKKGEFGKLAVSDYSKFENQYTGALRISYAILMRRQGAYADINNDGELNDYEELAFPCQTLKEIEELWKKYTDKRCRWSSEIDSYEQPSCRELDGKTLTVTLFSATRVYKVEERLKECGKIDPAILPQKR